MPLQTGLQRHQNMTVEDAVDTLSHQLSAKLVFPDRLRPVTV